MPTSTNVTNLKINELTEAQFDSAVSGGVIGANEISILTDVDEAIQVSTMPTASADELGKVYQFIGTTDASYTHGYFYECVSDGQQPATYSWNNVQVQASSGGLPSQTGNAGKFLTTDGTDASWSDKPLVNKATQATSIFAINNTNFVDGGNNVAIGNYSVVGTNNLSASYNVAIGDSTLIYRNSIGCVVVGRGSRAGSTAINYGVVIGHDSAVAANYAIQIGNGATNNDANTFKVSNNNGNYEIMSADGTIPTARLTKVNSTITLTSAGWSSNTQTVNVTGMTATGVVMVSPDPSNQSAYTSAGIICTAQATDSLTFTCTSTPSADLTVNVVML